MVGVGDVESPQIEGGVARHGGQIGIQQVVALLVQLGVVDAEYFVELRTSGFDLRQVEVIDHHGQRKLSEVIAIDLHFLQRLAEALNLGFLRIVYENVLGAPRAHQMCSDSLQTNAWCCESASGANECAHASCPLPPSSTRLR